MVRLLLAIRAGADPIGEQRRSDNCSSLATANAIGSGYQRTGVNRAEGANDHDRVVPLGDMSPKGTAIAPTPVGNRAEDYHERKIQGRGEPTAPLWIVGAGGGLGQPALPIST